MGATSSMVSTWAGKEEYIDANSFDKFQNLFKLMERYELQTSSRTLLQFMTG
jgi:hypothetical protein